MVGSGKTNQSRYNYSRRYALMRCAQFKTVSACTQTLLTYTSTLFTKDKIAITTITAYLLTLFYCYQCKWIRGSLYERNHVPFDHSGDALMVHLQD